MQKKYFIPVLVILFDQLTKLVMSGKRFWVFDYAENTGIAFGLFQGWNLLFVILSILVIGFLLNLFYTEKTNSIKIALLLILGGATSNLIDRIIFGFVRDFIDFGFWPVFNIADMVNVLGVLIIVYSMLITQRKRKI